MSQAQKTHSKCHNSCTVDQGHYRPTNTIPFTTSTHLVCSQHMFTECGQIFQAFYENIFSRLTYKINKSNFTHHMKQRQWRVNKNYSSFAVSYFSRLFSKQPWSFQHFAGKCFNPLPNTLFWDYPKFKEAADDNWNVAIKGFYNTDCTEDIVGKGEIAHFEQFHLFPQCFPKAFFFNVLKSVYMEESVKNMVR